MYAPLTTSLPETPLGAVQGKDVEFNKRAEEALEDKRKTQNSSASFQSAPFPSCWLPWHLLLVASTQLLQAQDQSLGQSSTQQHAAGHRLLPPAVVRRGLCLDLVEKRPTMHR